MTGGYGREVTQGIRYPASADLGSNHVEARCDFLAFSMAFI